MLSGENIFERFSNLKIWYRLYTPVYTTRQTAEVNAKICSVIMWKYMLGVAHTEDAEWTDCCEQLRFTTLVSSTLGLVVVVAWDLNPNVSYSLISIQLFSVISSVYNSLSHDTVKIVVNWLSFLWAGIFKWSVFYSIVPCSFVLVTFTKGYLSYLIFHYLCIHLIPKHHILCQSCLSKLL